MPRHNCARPKVDIYISNTWAESQARRSGGSPVIPSNRACAWPPGLLGGWLLDAQAQLWYNNHNFITTAGKARARGSVNGRLS